MMLVKYTLRSGMKRNLYSLEHKLHLGNLLCNLSSNRLLVVLSLANCTHAMEEVTTVLDFLLNCKYQFFFGKSNVHRNRPNTHAH